MPTGEGRMCEVRRRTSGEEARSGQRAFKSRGAREEPWGLEKILRRKTHQNQQRKGCKTERNHENQREFYEAKSRARKCEVRSIGYFEER